MELIFGVLTPVSVFLAIAGGGLIGVALLSELIQGDRFGTARQAAGAFGFLVGLLGIVFGGVFYVGQIVSSIADGDTQWPRAAARYALWVVYSISAGAGTWAGLHREWHR